MPRDRTSANPGGRDNGDTITFAGDSWPLARLPVQRHFRA